MFTYTDPPLLYCRVLLGGFVFGILFGEHYIAKSDAEARFWKLAMYACVGVTAGTARGTYGAAKVGPKVLDKSEQSRQEKGAPVA